jgi:hypothetical protein
MVSVMPAKAGIQTWLCVRRLWIPAYAGMTWRQGAPLIATGQRRIAAAARPM